MLIIDDLLLITFESIVDHANRQHVEYLTEYLKKITLMYERGQLAKEAFEEQKTKVLRDINAWFLHLERNSGARASRELGI